MYSSQSSSIANTLSLPSTYSVNRYLVGGKILTDSVSSQRISYQGSAIRDEILATDGTVLSAVLRTGVQNIPLSGLVVNSPPDVAHWFNALFSNPSLLIGTSTWGAGAAYMEYTATNIADRYRVFDAATVTSGSSPTPVASGTNLATLMAAGGIKSDSDAVTYTLSNGAISVISGVTTYVALIQRPKSTSRLYRTYYEIAGNVLTGDLLKAGETLGGSAYDTASNGVTSSHYDARYQLRINKAAVDSLKAAASF